MRTRGTQAGQRRHKASGFSLLEMTMVVAIVIVLASISFISMVPQLKAQRVTNAYNTTLSAMRQARDSAVSQRTSYSVTFTQTATQSSLTVAPTLTFTGDQNSTTYLLPNDVQFDAEPTVATVSPTPDSFGTGANAIDFGYTASGTGSGGQTVIYFCPDGSSQDGTGGAGACVGNWSGGVVYIARVGELTSSRAISLWGGTGRVRGWRLYPKNGGGYIWMRQ